MNGFGGEAQRRVRRGERKKEEGCRRGGHAGREGQATGDAGGGLVVPGYGLQVSLKPVIWIVMPSRRLWVRLALWAGTERPLENDTPEGVSL